MGCYYDYFSLPLLNPIEVFCDNRSYVIKLNELKSNEYSKLFTHKIKEHEDYFELLNILPKYFSIIYVKGHQDDSKTPEDLTIPERLNIEADIIAISKTKNPLNISLPSVISQLM